MWFASPKVTLSCCMTISRRIGGRAMLQSCCSMVCQGVIERPTWFAWLRSSFNGVFEFSGWTCVVAGLFHRLPDAFASATRGGNVSHAIDDGRCQRKEIWASKYPFRDRKVALECGYAHQIFGLWNRSFDGGRFRSVTTQLNRVHHLVGWALFVQKAREHLHTVHHHRSEFSLTFGQ